MQPNLMGEDDGEGSATQMPTETKDTVHASDKEANTYLYVGVPFLILKVAVSTNHPVQIYV